MKTNKRIYGSGVKVYIVQCIRPKSTRYANCRDKVATRYANCREKYIISLMHGSYFDGMDRNLTSILTHFTILHLHACLQSILSTIMRSFFKYMLNLSDEACRQINQESMILYTTSFHTILHLSIHMTKHLLRGIFHLNIFSGIVTKLQISNEQVPVVNVRF